MTGRNFQRTRRPLRPRRTPRLFRSAQPAWCTGPMHASEATAAVAPVARPAATSVATLLTRHILRDGETVLLILKPSLWFILFGLLRFIAVALILVISVQLWFPRHLHLAVEAGMLLITTRTAWAILSWMGRMYLLTDLRVLRLSGVFTTEIFDCPLRKVARTRLVPTFRERLLGLGSIEFIPSDDQRPCSTWQTIRRPHEIHEQVQRAIARAKQGGCNGGNGW
jgi:hypothetical protein